MVKIHPVVLFSILDHYIRRNEDQPRVIGALLGVRTATGVEVKNCFPVPHTEKDDVVAVGKEFLKQMTDLHMTVQSNEELLGWYATTADHSVLINHQSCWIQDFFTNECDKPLHLVVDTSLTGNSIGVKGFISNSVQLGDNPLAAAFTQLKVETVCSETERIGMDLMIKAKGRSKLDPSKQITNSEGIQSEIDGLQQSIARLLAMLETVSAYVDDVVANRRQPDPKIGTKIASVISMVPNIKPEIFAKSFRSSIQDMLMVVYLTNLTRTQLAVAEGIGATR